MKEEKKNRAKRGKECKKFTSQSSCCCLYTDLIYNLCWTFWLSWFLDTHNVQTVRPMTELLWMWQLNMATEPWGANACYSLHGHNFILCRGASINLRAEKCAHRSDQIAHSSHTEWQSTALDWDQWISSLGMLKGISLFSLPLIILNWQLNSQLRSLFSLPLSPPSSPPEYEWVPGFFSRCKVDRAPPSSAKARKQWGYTSTPLYTSVV